MDNFKSVDGKIAVVTGAASGLGEAIAKTFAANGMKVVLGDIQDAKGQAVADQINAAGGTALYCHADCRVQKDVQQLVAVATKKFGKLHCMVNNAGITYPTHPTHDFDLSDFDSVNDINYKAVFFGIKYAVDAMIATDSRGCSIINTVSGSGLRATEGLAFYTASKHGALGLTKVAALDYAKHDITVNAICPGVFKTAIFDGVPDEVMAVYAQMIPSGRLGIPQEVGWLALFLASDMARFINGASISIDSGFIAGDQNPASAWNNPDPRK